VQKWLGRNEFEPFASLQSIVMCYEIREWKKKNMNESFPIKVAI